MPLGSLADKLAQLIEMTTPAGRSSYTAREIARGTGLTPAYIQFLINGTRGKRVPHETLAKLAKFFDVPVSYFVDDDDSARSEEQLTQLKLLRALRRAEVRTVATRLSELSTADLRIFTDLLDRLEQRDDPPPPIGGQAGRR